MKKYFTPYYLFAFYKIATGVAELIIGSVLTFFSSALFHDLIIRMTSGELLEDPGDMFVAVVLNYLPIIASIKPVGIIILLNGAYDLVSGLGLAFKKAWAYDIILFVLVISVPIELYGFIKTPQFYKLISLMLTFIFIYVLINFKPKRFD